MRAMQDGKEYMTVMIVKRGDCMSTRKSVSSCEIHTPRINYFPSAARAPKNGTWAIKTGLIACIERSLLIH